MSTLTLTKDSVTGGIVGASIDDVAIDGFVSATQTLDRGVLKATLTINFDSIDVVENTPTPAPALVATFAAGTVTGATKATITSTLGSGNHYAYKIGSTAAPTPNVGETVTGSTTYTSGNDIAGVDATTNKYVSLYELGSDNRVVKFLSHTVISSEIGI